MNTVQSIPVRLYLLQLALGETGIPVPGYLIQTSDGINILVDTGLPNTESFSAQTAAMCDVIDQLAALGLTPRDIRFLVCTHFDVDHSGRHDAFPWSELVVQRAHYEVARSGGEERYEMTRKYWDHPSLTYRLVDGDTELVPGVDLIETNGHALGHQSLLVRLPQTGPVLLPIDATPYQANFVPDGKLGPYDEDEKMLQVSARKLIELAKHEGVKLIVFEHDKDQWPTMKKAPEFYD